MIVVDNHGAIVVGVGASVYNDVHNVMIVDYGYDDVNVVNKMCELVGM